MGGGGAMIRVIKVDLFKIKGREMGRFIRNG